MKILDFKVGDKVRRKSGPKKAYIEISTNSFGNTVFNLFVCDIRFKHDYPLPAEDIFADDWELV